MPLDEPLTGSEVNSFVAASGAKLLNRCTMVFEPEAPPHEHLTTLHHTHCPTLPRKHSFTKLRGTAAVLPYPGQLATCKPCRYYLPPETKFFRSLAGDLGYFQGPLPEPLDELASFVYGCLALREPDEMEQVPHLQPVWDNLSALVALKMADAVSALATLSPLDELRALLGVDRSRSTKWVFIDFVAYEYTQFDKPWLPLLALDALEVFPQPNGFKMAGRLDSALANALMSMSWQDEELLAIDSFSPPRGVRAAELTRSVLHTALSLWEPYDSEAPYGEARVALQAAVAL